MALNPRITDWRGRHVWLVGASTGIGHATAQRLHRLGAQVTVSARGAAALDGFVAAHPGARALALDATDADALLSAANQLQAEHGRIDLVLYCAGHYQAMQATSFDLAQALRHQQVNYVGALNLLQAVLPGLLRQAGAGMPAHLSLVASVAGYRGLPKALAYGPTKAALINLAEVLYLDLHGRGVGVSLVNPGFVATPLTAQNQFHMPALMHPDDAAQAMVAGWERGEFEIHFPKRFTRLLKALRGMPDGLYFGAIRRAVGHDMRHPDTRVARVVALYESLAPADLPGLRGVYADDARFKDPFNDVQGLAAIAAIFDHMFRTLESPRFQVAAIVADGDALFLTWDFHFRTRGAGARALRIHGASHLRFNAQGQVALHRDYWDTAEELYAKLPLLGGLVRWLGRRAGGQG